MDSSAEETKRRLTASIRATGAIAVGYAEAAPVSHEESDGFGRWLDGGNHASMEWLAPKSCAATRACSSTAQRQW
jgi:hypothetical protein